MSVETAPPRRLIVVPGSTAWLGVDLSTRAVSVASVCEAVHGSPENGLQRAVRTITWAPLDGAARLARIHEAVSLTLADHFRSGALPAPGIIGVEQPGGKSINWPLYTAFGVIQAAVYTACVLAKVPVPKIETPAPGWWKVRALGPGKGNTYKPKRDETHEYGVLTWAKSRGYGGASYDEADALGIAEALRREWSLDPR